MVWWNSGRMDYLHAVLSSAFIHGLPLRTSAPHAFSTITARLHSSCAAWDRSAFAANRTLERVETHWYGISDAAPFVDAERPCRTTVFCAIKHWATGASMAQLSRQL